MLFDGTFGTGGGSLGRLLAAAGDGCASDARDAGRRGLFVACDTARAAASGISFGSGGGLGDIETDVTEAE